MTTKTERPHNVHKVDSDLGMGTLNGALPPSAQAEKSGPPAKPHGLPVSSDAIPLIDRIGQTLRTLKQSEWRRLHERGGLIEPMFTKRQKLVCVRLQNGIALATINAALRVGMKNRLPIAEDSRTIEIEPGMRTTFRFVRIKAWIPEER